MPLPGPAFLSIWHDLKEGFEDAFEHWHTEEHMPERLGIPGFLHGRRYINWDAPAQVCYTVYCAAHIETFRSPGYLARLNAPTPWTPKVMAGMVQFLRGAADCTLSLGAGVGGALATLRLKTGEGDSDPTRDRRLQTAALQAMELPGVTGVHIGRHRPEIVAAKTSETTLRAPELSEDFDHILLVEALGMKNLDRQWSALSQLADDAGATVLGAGRYHLSYQLSAPH